METFQIPKIRVQCWEVSVKPTLSGSFTHAKLQTRPREEILEN